MNSSTNSKSKATSASKSKTSAPKKQGAGMKYEIANELGVNLGPDATARQNGQVGGEMTRRLVSMAKSNLKKNEQ